MEKDNACILAIESSCDDTSVAVLRDQKVLANITANQEVHKRYGGVIPELASRSHEKNMVPVMQEALRVAEVKLSDLSAVAYTQGPGLPGSLIVGNAFSKSLSMSLNIPLISVNHMQAHILAHFIEGVHPKPPSFPFLCLTVSGGHTQLVLVKDHFDMTIVGSTLDDAAGEAFDKIAKMLGLDYPGGPLVDKYAKEGNPNAFDFSKARVDGFNYSFSGLKTSVLYFLRKVLETNPNFIKENLADICASVQRVIVESLLETLEKCADQHGISEIALAGGVSANSGLRSALEERAVDKKWNTYVPPLQYCTDNAAMIGITGYLKYLKSETDNLASVAQSRMQF